MQTLTEIKLDVARNTSPPTVYAKQGDAATRYIKATLYDNGAAMTLESGISARIRVLKPDNTAIYNNATISGNTVTAELTSQALAAVGVAIAEIGLYKSNQILTTFIFYVRIEKSAVADEQIESSDEFGVLEETIQAATAATTAANTATAAANTATNNANAATSNANAAAATAENAVADIYHDKNFLLSVNDDGSLSLTYLKEE